MTTSTFIVLCNIGIMPLMSRGPRIPGDRLLPKFKVEVAYHHRYATCKEMSARTNFKNIEIQCQSRLRGTLVKISTLRRGRLSLCEVAVYGNHG